MQCRISEKHDTVCYLRGSHKNENMSVKGFKARNKEEGVKFFYKMGKSETVPNILIKEIVSNEFRKELV